MNHVGHVLNDYFNQTNPQWRRQCKLISNGGCDIYIRQPAKQASHYYSNTGLSSVLKLQSRSTRTPHRDRDCHPAGDKTKKGCPLYSLSVLQSLASGNPEDNTTPYEI